MKEKLYIFASLILFLISLFVILCPAWFKMDQYDNLLGLSKIKVYKGLWHRCVTLEAGAHECDTYMEPLQSLPTSIICSRSVLRTKL